jgi:hypothetical protein
VVAACVGEKPKRIVTANADVSFIFHSLKKIALAAIVPEAGCASASLPILIARDDETIAASRNARKYLIRRDFGRAQTMCAACF